MFFTILGLVSLILRPDYIIYQDEFVIGGDMYAWLLPQKTYIKRALRRTCILDLIPID
jgi:hypothetical protein